MIRSDPRKIGGGHLCPAYRLNPWRGGRGASRLVLTREFPQPVHGGGPR
jgi:hypothetical protein